MKANLGSWLACVVVLFSLTGLAPKVDPPTKHETQSDSKTSVAESPKDAAENTDAPEPSSATDADGIAAAAPELLAKFIRVNTVNPPGNETDGARFLADTLNGFGIDAEIYESSPGRGNLVARVKGDGSKKPILLLSHLDVVPAMTEAWERDPFAGEIADGYVHGRGALDAKGVGLVQVLGLASALASDVELKRDVIILATADEETGGSKGAAWMIENHLDLFGDAEFVLNEGGFIRASDGKPLIYNLNAAEKGPCWFRVTAVGDPGHGSRPATDTSVSRLVSALNTLLAWEQPVEVGSVVAGYYAALASHDEEHARQLRQLARSLDDDEFYDWFMSDPAAAALVRNTIAPTVISAGTKTNVVPAEASAEVDARLLPGHDCDRFLSEVRGKIGSADVRVEALPTAFPSSQSPLDNPLTAAIESLAEQEPTDAVVLSGLLAGFTDSHYFREQGIHAYGFSPIVVTADERKRMHGPNERVGVQAIQDAVRRMSILIQKVAG